MNVWNASISRYVRNTAARRRYLYLIHARGMVAVITIILEACPCAAITTLFAIKFGHDQKLAVGAVTLSTLISIITLPCLALLAGEIIM